MREGEYDGVGDSYGMGTGTGGLMKEESGGRGKWENGRERRTGLNYSVLVWVPLC